MNRRQFVKTLGSAAVMTAAPVAAVAEIVKESEIQSWTSPWISHIGYWRLPPKPCTIIYSRPAGQAEWNLYGIFDGREDTDCTAIFEEDGTGYKEFSTGYDPITGCIDEDPYEFEKKISNCA